MAKINTAILTLQPFSPNATKQNQPQCVPKLSKTSHKSNNIRGKIWVVEPWGRRPLWGPVLWWGTSHKVLVVVVEVVVVVRWACDGSAGNGAADHGIAEEGLGQFFADFRFEIHRRIGQGFAQVVEDRENQCKTNWRDQRHSLPSDVVHPLGFRAFTKHLLHVSKTGKN